MDRHPGGATVGACFAPRARLSAMSEAVTHVTCANGHGLDEPSDLPADAREPCPVCGSMARTFHVSITAVVEVSGSVAVTHVPASEVPADETPEAEAVRGRYRATLDWQTLPDGTWLVQVFNSAGVLVDGGIGDNAEDALLELYERLIPPASSE